MESTSKQSETDTLLSERRELAESRLDYILSHTPIIFFSTDKKGILNYASGRFLEKIGLSADSMVGTSFLDYDWNAEFRQSDGTSRFIKPVEALELVLGSDGEVVAETVFASRFFSFRLSPSKDESGRSNGMIGIAIDITDQKLVEREFASRTLDYKTVIGALPVIVFSISREGRILLAEGKGLERLGFQSGETVGQTIYERAEARPEVLEAFHRALAGEESFYQSVQNGRFLETRMYPKIRSGKDTEEVLGITYDISDRLVYESKVRESEENYRNLFQNNPQIMILFDREEFRVVAVNRTAIQIYGYSEEEFVGKPILELRLPEDREEVRDKIRNLEIGPNFFQEVRHIRKDASIMHLDLVTSMMRFGGKDCVLVSGTDVSARVETEKRNRFNLAVLSQVSDAVIALDNRRKIVYYNEPAASLYGIGSENYIGRHYTDLFTPEWFSENDKENAMKDWDLEGTSKMELVHVLPSGRKIAIETNFKKFQSEGDDEPGVIMVNRDITEKIASRNSLQQALKDLEKTNKELEQFAYVASHDLQEPLRTIASYLQLLERKFQEDIKPEMREFIRISVEAAKRQQGLIESLLSYSRVGASSVKKEKISLHSVLEEAVRDLSSVLSDHSVKLEIKGELPEVYADSDQICRLLINLISNGVKFRYPNRDPIVSVTSRKIPGFWEFEVSDNGIGMDAKYFDRIFIIFQKLHVRTQYPGTGIGLSICKKIVENHGGRIWVKSSIGEGSQFFFTLPEVNG
ncbi:PAS domain-containing sensor histidine kinase [Leptospira wolffii]|uniref:PAS domain-containing sensor histidine kinase n=1 Tax=Leptospira wolffii TaxID=409998 RepID=UPI001AEF5FDE|nr:PAS domain S-box protein [Leptospira wolffii]